MASSGRAYGLAPTAGFGTQPIDLQRIIGAEYANAGIIAGTDVAGTTGWTYSVAAGAVVQLLATAPERLGVIIPVAASAPATDPAPAAGTRTDTIWVSQDGIVGVAPKTAMPAGAFVLQQRTVRAGDPNTGASTGIGGRVQALPVGGSQGRFAQWVEPYGFNTVAGKALITLLSASITVGTDRHIEIWNQQALRTNGPGGTMRYEVMIDGVSLETYEMPYDTSSVTRQMVTYTWLEAGTHTVAIRRVHASGSDPLNAGGGEHNITPSKISVWDKGIAY